MATWKAFFITISLLHEAETDSSENLVEFLLESFFSPSYALWVLISLQETGKHY